MVKENLIKKISKGLSILALSTLIGSGICYSKETNQSGYDVPDLSKDSFIGAGNIDLTKKIAGEETLMELYKTAKGEYVWKASINDKIFLYMVVDATKVEKNQYDINRYAIADRDGDGIFETKYDEKDLSHHGEDGIFHKDLPPDWVLK